MEELDLKLVFEPESEHEALAMKAALEERGIKAFLEGLDASALGNALDGDEILELFVQAEDYARADQLLIEIFDEEEADDVPAWTCQCGEEVDAGFFFCWNCEAEYQSGGKDD